MMTYEEFEKKAIQEVRDAIKNIPYGDKEEYLRMCIPYLPDAYESDKHTAEFLGWDDIGIGGMGYAAYLSYPGLEFLGGPNGDEIEEEKRRTDNR